MRLGGALAVLALASVAMVAMPAHAVDVGTIYFGNTANQNLNPHVDPGVPPGGNAECGYDTVYNAALTAPAAGKAYTGAAYIGDACYIYFDFTAVQGFTFAGDAAINALVGCDAAAAIIEVDAHVWVAGTEIANAGNPFVGYIPPVTCQSGSPLQVTIPLVGAEGTVVKPGDVVSTGVIVFGQNPPMAPGAPSNMYIVTGAATSSLSGPGIPTGVLAGGAEGLALTAEKSNQKTTPGASATYDLTVRNVGVATNFTMSAAISSGYGVAFSPLEGAIASNASAVVRMQVTAPASAQAGTHITFKAKVTGAKGTNTTLDLSLDVEKAGTGSSSSSGGPGGSGSSQSSTSSDSFTTPGDSDSKKSPGVEFAANLLAVGLLVVALRRRTA